MGKVIWSPSAKIDLKEIIEYISKDSKYYAQIFGAKLFASTKKLKEFPLLGRIVPEYSRQDLREIIFQNYRIIYRVKENFIEIVTVCHGSVDIKRKMDL
ncbi:MAG: type II toxin-antitoxin system RelE/ParE family toxin [Nitrospinae bacterium]|nr:type II toxin-antitoxin system RelE/ParE family toxin [Nitrospinota bacterium]